VMYGGRSQIGTFDAGNWMAQQEREVGGHLSPAAFAERAPGTVGGDTAREVLKDMGLPPLPYSMSNPTIRSMLLDASSRMTPEQVAEFLRRVHR
jgi:hypothetical protein